MSTELRIGIYIGPMAHHRRWCTAFNDGLKRHNINAVVVEDSRLVDCDLAVFWAHRRQDVIDHQKRAGKDYLVLEHGYVGERLHQWTSAGLNGLNGRAAFPVAQDGGRRWRKHFDGMIKPWKKGGDHVLLIGQVAGDASIAHVDINKWYVDTIDVLQAAGKTVIFRPHPVSIGIGQLVIPKGVAVAIEPLDRALSKAEYIVTFSSNTGVVSMLQGVPVVACDEGSMVWELAGKDPASFPGTPAREAWAYDMAYKQWTEEEFKTGKVWETFRQHYE